MSNIFLFVRYDGVWGESNSYEGGKTLGISVHPSSSYAALVDRLYEDLQLTPLTHTTTVKYEAGVFAPVTVSDDRGLQAYFDLKRSQSDTTKFPLCLDICEVETTNTFGEWGNQDGDSFDFPDEVERPVTNLRTSPACPDSTTDGHRSVPQSPGGERSTFTDGHVPVSQAEVDPLPTVESGNIDSLHVSDIRSPVRVQLLGMYANKGVLQRHLQLFAINNHFQFKTKVSHKEVLHVICNGINCNWTVRAVRLRNSDIFQIRRFDSDHTCSTDVRQGEHPQATSSFVASCVKHKYVDLGTSECRPKDIVQIMQREYGVSMSYKKALRSKEKALETLYGTPQDTYAFLPTLSYMIKSQNPGSVIDVVTDDNDRFLYFFMCLQAFINGWPYCRPVIIVDASFLKAYYRGTMFIACAMDANEQIFPLAFGVGESESNESWEFFFAKLKDAIADREDLVIVSDRHNAIINAVRKIFPNAEHGFCVHHLLGNIRNKFKQLPKEVNWKFYGAAKAYTTVEWERFMQMLDQDHNGIRSYLEQEVGHHRWARCFFTSRRYSIMTSNNAESMNSLNKKARDSPLGKLIEWFAETMQKWFYERREKAAGTLTPLSVQAEKRLRVAHGHSTAMTVYFLLICKYFLNASVRMFKRLHSNVMQVIPSGVYEFLVRDQDGDSWVVNLEDKTCTCREFQIDQFICAHGIAACRVRGFSVYDYISKFFTTVNWADTYAGIVHPTGSASRWTIPAEIQQRIVKTPIFKNRPSGRPRKRRILSQGEERLQQKCSRCGAAGHNRKTCRSSIPLSQQTDKQN